MVYLSLWHYAVLSCGASVKTYWQSQFTETSWNMNLFTQVCKSWLGLLVGIRCSIDTPLSEPVTNWILVTIVFVVSFVMLFILSADLHHVHTLIEVF